MVAPDCEISKPDDQKKFALSTLKGVDVLVIDMKYSDRNYIEGHGHNNCSNVLQILDTCWPLGREKEFTLFAVHRGDGFPDGKLWDTRQIRQKMGHWKKAIRVFFPLAGYIHSI
jgi:hypothetical protein